MCGGQINIITAVDCLPCQQASSVVNTPTCIHPIDYLFEQAVPIATANAIHIVDAVIQLLNAGLIVSEKEDFCLLDNTHNYSFYGFGKVAGLTTVVNYLRFDSVVKTCATPCCVNMHGSLVADGLYHTLFPNKPKTCDTYFAKHTVALMNEIENNITVSNLGIIEANSINGVSSIGRIIANIKVIDPEITPATLTTKITDLLNAGLYFKPSPTGHVFASATGFVTWLMRYNYNTLCG